jgi:hypothetical protein
VEEEVWPSLPPEILGNPLTKEEEETLLGDCLAYATAKVANEPLLATGDDFAKTDLALA